MPSFLRTPFTYIKTIIIFAPILISSCALLLSSYNFDSKGMFYLIGTLINTFFGWMFAKIWPHPKPGMEKIPAAAAGAAGAGAGAAGAAGAGAGRRHARARVNTKLRLKQGEDLGSINCNIFGLDANWGIEGLGSTPDSHALFLAFTFTYILLGAIENSKGSSSIVIIIVLGIFMLLSGGFRTSSMKCCQPWDILIGWFLGAFTGFLWFGAMMLLSDHLKIHVTYFSDPPGNSKCNLSDKEYKCDIISDST